MILSRSALPPALGVLPNLLLFPRNFLMDTCFSHSHLGAYVTLAMSKPTHLDALWQQERDTVENALICPCSMGCDWPIPLPLHKLGNALSLHRGGPEPGLHSHELLAGWISWCREQGAGSISVKGGFVPSPQGFLERSPGTPQILSWRTSLISTGRWPSHQCHASSRVLFTTQLPTLPCPREDV